MLYISVVVVAAVQAFVRKSSDLTELKTRLQVLPGFDDCITRIEYDPKEVTEALFRVLEAQMTGSATVPAVTNIAPWYTGADT